MVRKHYTSPGADGGDPFEFDIDGVEFATVGTVSLLDVSELAQLADEDLASVAGMSAIAELFKGALGPVNYRRFKVHTRAHNTTPEQILEIMRDMVEHVSQGNSVPSTRSSGGRPNTNGGSRDSSPSAGDRAAELLDQVTRGLPRETLTPEALERIRRVIDGEVTSVS